MKKTRRRVLATWVAGALLLPLGVLSNGVAPAAALPNATVAAFPATGPVTPDMPTLNIRIDDPNPAHTVSWLSQSKDNVALARFSIEDPSGQFNLPEQDNAVPATGEVKTRGNYTWTLAKKPYQIKFPSKSTAPLGMDPNKTWVLLANHADASLMRNKVAYDLGKAVGLTNSPDSRWVDVRMNGSYIGNYLMTEKVEAKPGRVELSDPQGVITELDRRGDGSQAGYPAEDYWFHSTKSSTTFTLKDAVGGVPDKPAPLPADTAAGWADMKATINKLDTALYAANPDWAYISSIIDVDSFVKYYFVFELAENPEIVSSSVYFYKNGPSSKLFAGPVWDFDSALANYDKSEPYGADYRSEYVKNAQALRAKYNGWQTELFRNKGFVEAANAQWHAGIAYHVSQLPSKIDGYYNTVKGSAANNFVRWPSILGHSTLLVAGEGKTYASTYAGEYTYLKTWVTNRQNMLRKLYGNDVPMVRARGYVQSKSWMPYVNTGQFIGTTGLALRLEGMNLALLPGTANGSVTTGTIQANSHVQSIGWSGYKTIGSSTLIGTTGRNLRMEAVQFKLTGNLATKYVISYRAHVQGIGWMPWKSDGATAGTTGQAKRVEAVQVRLVLKTVPTPLNP